MSQISIIQRKITTEYNNIINNIRSRDTFGFLAEAMHLIRAYARTEPNKTRAAKAFDFADEISDALKYF